MKLFAKMKRLSPQEAEERVQKRQRTTQTVTTIAQTNTDTLQKRQIIHQYLKEILDYLHGRSASFITAHYAAQQLAKFDPKLSECGTGDAHGKFDLIDAVINAINTAMDHAFEVVSRSEGNGESPLIELYRYCQHSLRLKLECLYPLYHGLRGIGNSGKHANNPLFKKLLRPTMANVQNLTSLNENGYPTSEAIDIFKILFVNRFIVNLHDGISALDDDERFYNMNDTNKKIMNRSQRRLFVNLMDLLDYMKVQFLDGRFQLINDSEEFDKNIEEPRHFIQLLQSFNEEKCIPPIRKCFVKSINESFIKLMSSTSTSKFYEVFKLEAKIINIQDLYNVHHFPNDMFDQVLQRDANVQLMKITMEGYLIEAYQGKITRGFQRECGWISQKRYMRDAWESTISKFLADQLSLLGKPVEESLKQMSSYIEKLSEVAVKMDKIVQNCTSNEPSSEAEAEAETETETETGEKNVQSREVIATISRLSKTAITSHWKTHLQRPFPRHYAHYLNYKLKSIVKANSRKKFENDLHRLRLGISIILPMFTTSDRVDFKRLYETMIIPRMISILYDANFNIYTNVMDAELEISEQCDELLPKHEGGQVFLKSICEEVERAYNDIDGLRELVCGKVPELEGWEMAKFMFLPLSIAPHAADIAMKKKDALAMPSVMNAAMRQFKVEVKNRVQSRNGNKNGNGNGSCKLKFGLDYANSRMELEMSTHDGTPLLVSCNMFQGLILTLFDDGIEKIDVSMVSRKLNMREDVARRHLRVLSSERMRLLVEVDDASWMVNERFSIPAKCTRNEAGVAVLYIK